MSTVKEHIEIDPKLRIVIASSSREFTTSTQRLLKTGGFQNVALVEDPTVLFQHCSTQAVGVVICDHVQNGVEAWQLIKTLKTDDSIPNLPIIFTGKGQSPVGTQELTEYGIAEYLPQPFDLRHLMNTLVTTYELHQRQGTTESKFSAAKLALINNRTTDAIETYSDLFEETNHNTRSTLGLAQAYEKNRDTHQAQKVLSQAPDDADVNVLQMKLKIALSTENLSEASEIIQNIMKSTDYSELYFRSCIETCASSKSWSLVQKLVRAAFKRALHNKEFYLYAARASYNLDTVDEALEFLDTAEKLSGPSMKIFEIRGRCQLKQHKYDAAVKTYTDAINLDPKNPQSLFNRALALLSNGRVAEAEADLLLCLKVSPSFVLATQKLKEIKTMPRKAG